MTRGHGHGPIYLPLDHRSPRRTAVGDPLRTAGCSLSVYDPCHLRGRVVIESMSLFGTFRSWRDARVESVMHSKADIGRARRRGPVVRSLDQRAAAWGTGRGPGNRYACRSGPRGIR
jgi:hypothetical protein